MQTTESTDKARKGWTATYTVVLSNGARRAQGRMMNGTRIVRDAFSVKIADDGRFAVDVGTGSGVKVKFHHSEES